MNSVTKVSGLLGNGSAFVVDLPQNFDLERKLRSAATIRLATAFAHWSGWKCIKSYVENSNARSCLLTGLAFCQTEPTVLTDWCELAKARKVEPRLFINKGVTFHPKVLIVSGNKSRFAVVGSGNLSEGGFLNNIECSIYTENAAVVDHLTQWFDSLFENERLTKRLRAEDVRQYRPRYEAARAAKQEVTKLQEEVEGELGESHRNQLAEWHKAIAQARRFFASKEFKESYEEQRRIVREDIKTAIGYPDFDFDYVGLTRFYDIQDLGHLIQIRKDSVWKERKKLRHGLLQLIDDSKPIEVRINDLLNERGRHRIYGVGPNFVSKILAVHNPQEYSVLNDPVKKSLDKFGYERHRGTIGQKYAEFASLMRRFMKESGARDSLAVDAFFYHFWEQNLKVK